MIYLYVTLFSLVCIIIIIANYGFYKSKIQSYEEKEMQEETNRGKVYGYTTTILKKIRENCRITQADRMRLIEFLHCFIKKNKFAYVYDITFNKKYTYKEATETILQYILPRPELEKVTLAEVYEATLYLILKG